MAILYILSGTALVIAFIVVLVYYFSPKRKVQVEAAKYEMLNDDSMPASDNEQDPALKKE